MFKRILLFSLISSSSVVAWAQSPDPVPDSASEPASDTQTRNSESDPDSSTPSLDKEPHRPWYLSIGGAVGHIDLSETDPTPMIRAQAGYDAGFYGLEVGVHQTLSDFETHHAYEDVETRYQRSGQALHLMGFVDYPLTQSLTVRALAGGSYASMERSGEMGLTGASETIELDSKTASVWGLSYAGELSWSVNEAIGMTVGAQQISEKWLSGYGSLVYRW